MLVNPYFLMQFPYRSIYNRSPQQFLSVAAVPVFISHWRFAFGVLKFLLAVGSAADLIPPPSSGRGRSNTGWF